MSVWTVTIIDDESPIVRVYSTRDKAMADAVERVAQVLGLDSDDVQIVVNEQPVL